MVFNKEQDRFDLRQGADLPCDKDPYIKRCAFSVSMRVNTVGDGTIVVQGYVTHGLVFATTQLGRRKVFHSSANLPREFSVTATLKSEGGLTLSADDQEMIVVNLLGLIREQPLDGLQVGGTKVVLSVGTPHRFHPTDHKCRYPDCEIGGQATFQRSGFERFCSRDVITPSFHRLRHQSTKPSSNHCPSLPQSLQLHV